MPTPRSKIGISGVVAALAILSLALITMASITLMMHRMTGFNLGTLRESLEKRRESIAIYLYNASLCQLLAGNFTPCKWRLVIINTGPVEVEVNSLVVEKLGTIILQKKNIQLKPSEYKSFMIGDGEYHDAKVYVHTKKGSLFIGGYEIPDPYMLVEIDEHGRCTEP